MLVIEVRLLGPVSALVDGAPVALGGAKPRAVLALLALGMPRATTTSSIIDAVWGTHAPESARNAVQVYVSGLRKALPRDVIERDGDGYRLVGAGLAVDSAEFERRVSAGRSALRAGDAHRASEVLGSALSMWAGEPLGGLEDLPMFDTTTQALKDTRALAQVERAESLLRSGDFDEAGRAAQEVTRERPYEERAWGLLAAASYHAGRQSEALATCREARRLLASELGVDPSPALAQVEADILAQRLEPPWPAPASAPPAAGNGATEPAELPPSPSPLVGRQELVDDVVARVARGRVVSLVGLGGIGKTTVAVAVAHALRADGRSAAFCELETETSAATALESICRTLRVDPGDDPVAALAQAGQDVVVVLDNIEQIVDFGPVVAEVLKATGLTLLTTTRRALHLRDEDVVPVTPLSLEARGSDASPAVELFLSRVERVRGGFDRSAALGASQQVCVALEGIPLAIEIVAARSRLLTVDQLASRLASGVDSSLDASRAPTSPVRQLSLATIIASADRPPDRRHPRRPRVAMRRRGVDRRSTSSRTWWTAISARAAWSRRSRTWWTRVWPSTTTPAGCACGPRCASSCASARSRIGKGWSVTRSPAPPTWSWPSRRALTALRSSDAVARLERDHDPVSGSLDRAIEGGMHAQVAALITGLQRYWLMGDRIPEGLRWIEAGLAVHSLEIEERCRLEILQGTFASYLGEARVEFILQPSLDHASTLGLPIDRSIVNGWCCLAAWRAQRGETERATDAAGRAMQAAQQSGQGDLVALASDLAGYVASHCGDYAAALEAHLVAATEARRSGHTHALIGVLNSLVDDMAGLGRFDEAMGIADEAFDLLGSRHSVYLRGMVLTIRGLALTCTARVAEAEGCLVEALRIGRDHLPDPVGQGDRLALLAIGAALERDDVRSGRLWGAARALHGDVGTSAGARLPAAIVAEVAAAAERGGPAFATAETVGSLSPDRVIDELLATNT